MASQPKHYISVEEYLKLEETSVERHEYLDGEMFAIAGASLNHSVISLNLLSEIKARLGKGDCRVLGSDMRIRTSPSGLFCYADGVVSCKPEEFDGDTLLNPVVIIEVLSPSTGDYDRGAKFERYRQIPSFREYLIVAQDRVYVEHHVRGSADNSTWTMREFTSLNDAITFSSVAVHFPCSAIYAGVEFPSQPTD